MVAQLRWIDELRTAGAPPLDWLWPGYLVKRGVTVMTSREKSGKTTLISVLLSKTAAGGNLLTIPVTPARVVVVTEEMETLWLNRDGTLKFANVGFIVRPFLGPPSLEQWRELLKQIVEEHRQQPLDLVVFDPLGPLLPCYSENHPSQMYEAMAPVRLLADAGVSVLLLHHPSKNQSTKALMPRGTRALAAWADVLLELDKTTGATSTDRRRWLRTRSRFAATPRDRLIEWTEDETDYKLVTDTGAKEYEFGWKVLKTILEDADYKLTRSRIHKNWPDDHERPHRVTLWKWLERAVADKRICRQGAGRNRAPFEYWLPGHEGRLWSDLPQLAPVPPLGAGTLPETLQEAKPLIKAAKKRIEQMLQHDEVAGVNGKG